MAEERGICSGYAQCDWYAWVETEYLVTDGVEVGQIIDIICGDDCLGRARVRDGGANLIA